MSLDQRLGEPAGTVEGTAPSPPPTVDPTSALPPGAVGPISPAEAANSTQGMASPTAALPPGASGPISPEEAGQRAAASNGAITLIPPKIVAARMGELASLHGWMPHDMAFGVAETPISDHQMLALANTLRDVYKTVDDSLHFIHNDPVLQKQPSALLSFQRYLNSSVGPWPIEDQNVTDIQKGIQKAGFGQGLATSGVWDSGWNAAYDQWKAGLATAQLGGNQVGSKPAGGVLHALTNFLPKEAGNAIIGFVKAIPHEVRQAFADVGGAAVGDSRAIGSLVANVLTTGSAGNFAGVGSSAARDQVQFGHEVAPWDPTYFSQQNLEHESNLGALGRGASAGLTFSSAGDIGKGLLTVHAAMKAGSDVSLANGVFAGARQAVGITGSGRKAAVAELGLKDAYRGPGVVANSLGQALKIGDHLPFVNNVPVLGRIGPWVAKLPDADGLYYRARTLLATPSAFMPVRVAGTAMGQAGLIGAKLHAEAALVGATAGSNPFTQAVQGGQALDGIDNAMRNRLQFTALGHHVQIGLDTLPFLLHVPATAGLAPSATVGREAQGVVSAASHALGTSAALAPQIERGTGQKLPDLIKGFDGGMPDFIRFWTHNVYQHAAAHYSEVELRRLPADAPELATDQTKLDFMRAKQHEALSELAETGNPTILNNAIKEMLGNEQGTTSYEFGGTNELSKRIAKEIGYSGRSAKKVQGDANALLRASDLMENHVIPNADMLVHPGTEEQAGGQVASLGLMRKDNLDAAGALSRIAQFRQRAENPALTIGASDQLESEVRDFLHVELGMNGKAIPGNLTDALTKAEDYARNNLAGPVRLHADAPGSLQDAAAKIDGLGYKIVHGTDIGWRHVPQTPLDVVSAPLTRRRLLAEHLGLNPDSTPTADVSFWKQLSMRSAIQKLVDEGKITLPPYHTADTLVAHLWDGDALDLSPDPLTRIIHNTLGQITKRRQIDELIPEIQSQWVNAKTGAQMSRVKASVLAADDLGRELTRSLGLENVSRRKIVQALTTKDVIPEGTRREMERVQGDTGLDPQLMTEKDANRVYRAIVQGSAGPPGYVLGLSKLDALARTGFGAMGFLGDAVPGKAGDMLANLPNSLLTIRNRMRFQLSPEFSARRIAKANVKLWMDGVPATIRPLHDMIQAGTRDDDLATLDRVMPELSNKQFDSVNESLYSNDVFGFYSHKNYEAYAAGHWARQGLSDPEIRALLVKNFGYGSAANGEGRSAMERSINTVFFPFSFDKTLYRNVGGYLLDNPARMMLLTGALNAYNAFNQAHQNGDVPGSASWFAKHVPVAQELLRLNAFAHGIGLGQFGGINAPLLNMFLPQKWDSAAHSASTIASLMPAYTELKDLFKEATDQGMIFDQTAKDEWAKYTDPNWHPADWVPAETSQAQQTDAYALRRQIMASVNPYLTYNAMNKKAPLSIPKDPRYGKYQGDVISTAMVDRMVHDQFPAYDPNQAVAYGDIQKQNLATYLDNLSGPTASYIRQWTTLAQQVGLMIYEGKFDPADAAMWTGQIRHAAIGLAERDPEFYKMYNGSYGFRWEFGPLTEVKS